MATPPPLPDPREVRTDIVLALALAQHGRAQGELVAALRRRLCWYVHALAEPARAWAALQDPHTEHYLDVVRRAVQIATTGGLADQEPAHALRLLAKAADSVARMAGARPTPATAS